MRRYAVYAAMHWSTNVWSSSARTNNNEFSADTVTACKPLITLMVEYTTWKFSTIKLCSHRHRHTFTHVSRILCVCVRCGMAWHGEWSLKPHTFQWNYVSSTDGTMAAAEKQLESRAHIFNAKPVNCTAIRLEHLIVCARQQLIRHHSVLRLAILLEQTVFLPANVDEHQSSCCAVLSLLNLCKHSDKRTGIVWHTHTHPRWNDFCSIRWASLRNCLTFLPIALHRVFVFISCLVYFKRICFESYLDCAIPTLFPLFFLFICTTMCVCAQCKYPFVHRSPFEVPTYGCERKS